MNEDDTPACAGSPDSNDLDGAAASLEHFDQCGPAHARERTASQWRRQPHPRGVLKLGRAKGRMLAVDPPLRTAGC